MHCRHHIARHPHARRPHGTHGAATATATSRCGHTGGMTVVGTGKFTLEHQNASFQLVVLLTKEDNPLLHLAPRGLVALSAFPGADTVGLETLLLPLCLVLQVSGRLVCFRALLFLVLLITAFAAGIGIRSSIISLGNGFRIIDWAIIMFRRCHVYPSTTFELLPGAPLLPYFSSAREYLRIQQQPPFTDRLGLTWLQIA
mmetsp:Transcript_9073/g.19457  ORF Transcript_9073/g.19457 Transcript_9073/m.19457 type:complete len:200 (-) Transcript_9073:203-802(-)